MIAKLYVLADHRQAARPRVSATTSGSVILLVGTGEHEREEWIDLAGARALLDELADAIDAAEFLARVSREVTGG